MLRLGVLFFFAGYFAFSLVATGYLYPRALRQLDAQLDPLALLNASLLTASFGYLGLRFFVQRAPKLSLMPYLPRPVPEWPLVHFAQMVSLSSLLNVFPFFFVTPVWLRFVWRGPYSAWAAVAWGAGVALLVLGTHFLNNALRLMIAQDARRFILTVAAVLVAAVLDAALGVSALTAASTYVFGALLDGSAVALGGLLLVTLLAYAASARRLHRSLRDHTHADTPLFRSWQAIGFSSRRSTTVNLMLLDLRLVLRNKRPRSVIGMAAAFGAVYPPITLYGGLGESLSNTALAGFFALVLAPSSYGQYLFSWDSQHFDGLLVRVRSLETLVRARLLALYLLALATSALLLPFFAVLAPRTVPAFLCVLAYTVGVASTAILLVALFNRKPIRLEQGGAFNYEGLSMQQFLVNIPVFLPPMLLFLFLDPRVALLITGGLGLCGIILFPVWVLLFTRLLRRSRHRMAASFRAHGD